MDCADTKWNFAIQPRLTQRVNDNVAVVSGLNEVVQKPLNHRGKPGGGEAEINLYDRVVRTMR
jgi:hypothetical protein